MSKEKNCVISVRLPGEVLKKIDQYVQASPVKISRSAAIVYFIQKGLKA